jgi:hypothetical protein
MIDQLLRHCAHCTRPDTLKKSENNFEVLNIYLSVEIASINHHSPPLLLPKTSKPAAAGLLVSNTFVRARSGSSATPRRIARS